jgi:hypothetical protein
MEWIRKRELQSRAASDIQKSYDRLSSRKICSNEDVMNYLNSLSAESNRYLMETQISSTCV